MTRLRARQQAISLLVALISVTPLHAQTGAVGYGIEEVIVTAQKREESIQDAPISILAFSANQLEARGISGLERLQIDVPSLTISPHPQSGTTMRVFIRGIGIVNDQITYDPSVAIYLDGAYVARFQGLAADVAEIERVEVLRGPQGSLYGRNSTGGAINFITKAPQLGEFGFRQDISIGNYSMLRSRTRINVPIGDTLAAELSFLRIRKDGFVRNAGTGVSRYGDEDRRGYRAAFLWQPAESLDLRYTYDRSELDDTPTFMARVPMYPQKGHRPTRGSPAEDMLPANSGTGQGHNLTMTFRVDDSLTLRSITAYRELDSWTDRRYHPGVVAPAPLNWTTVDIGQHQFSEELQAIGSALGDQLEYVAGLYWFKESGTGDQVGRRPLVPDSSFNHYTARNKASAAFAQGTYTPAALDGRLHLTAGVRWSRDEREATRFSQTTPGNGIPLPAEFGKAKRKFNDTSPSVVIAFDMTDDINVYAKHATGYKTGGFNLQSSSNATFARGFGPELVKNYELGIKSDWFSNRLRVNAALFSADYEDIQLSVSSDPDNIAITDVLNAGKASVDGLELDVLARPLPELSASLSYAWLDAGFDKIRDVTNADITKKYGFVEAPKHKVAATLEYTWPETRFGIPSFMVTYAYQSKRIASTSCKTCIIDSYGLLDARLSLSDIAIGKSRLRLSLWGRNLTDEEYYTMYLMVLVPTAVFGEPRSYGIDATLEL